MLIKLLTRIALVFAPASEHNQYDRYELWRHPWRYLLPNALAASVWLSLLVAFPLSWPLTVALEALLWLNGSFVAASIAVTVLPRFGIGPHSFD